jgi:hypothetical protein
MRNVFLALVMALVFLLGACNTTAPKAANACGRDPTCSNTDPNQGGDPNTTGGTDNGGTNNGGTDNGGTDTTGGTGGNPTPGAFDNSLMKGFVTGYKGNKVLSVKSLWIDQSNGQIIDLGTDPNARLELNGEFGVRLGTPADTALATLPLPIICGTLTTTTVPAGLSEVKGLLVPALFVFDGDQLVGLILHGSYHLDDYGNLIPSAKLAMRVYSATDKIISKGTCSGELSTDMMTALNSQSIGNALSTFGVNAPEVANLVQTMAATNKAKSAALPVNLTVDLGLKKGWNTVVLGADAAGGTLEVSLIDDTQPNFTWYYLDLTQFLPNVQ